MTALTIKGQVFNVEDDARIQVGTPLTDAMAATLQQTRRENIRNNMSRRVEEALEGRDELSPDKFNELQSLVDEYANKYEFGVRQPGAPRVTDPVEKEARYEVAELIKAAHYAQHGERLKGESLSEAVTQVMAVRGDEFRQLAREKIEARTARAGNILDSITLSGERVAAE